MTISVSRVELQSANRIQSGQATERFAWALRQEADDGRRAMIKFSAAYLAICLLLQWMVVEASPWIASHVLLRWML